MCYGNNHRQVQNIVSGDVYTYRRMSRTPKGLDVVVIAVVDDDDDDMWVTLYNILYRMITTMSCGRDEQVTKKMAKYKIFFFPRMVVSKYLSIHNIRYFNYNNFYDNK